MKSFNKEFLSSFEKKFTVNYPKVSSPTYKSLVNYASDLNTPIQRWYRYKEGYSVKLVNEIFKKYGVKQGDLIVDPFCGSGSTLLQAKINKCKSIGFEINPFSAFLAKTKTQDYKNQDIRSFEKTTEKLRDIKQKKSLPIPKLSTIEQLFEKDTLLYLLSLKQEIDQVKNKKILNLLTLAWLSILEESSNYRKAGNGLKFRKTKKKINRNQKYAEKLFFAAITEIREDLSYAVDISSKVDTDVIEESCFNLNKHIKKNSVKGIIFSPPYANCFDYTEIYKVELWMGSFVKDYSDLKILREKGIRSHLNGYKVGSHLAIKSVPELGILVKELSRKKLWDKRIPKMVEAYFNDMFHSLVEIYKVLEKKGFCVIIVSNSAYGGTIIPTDLLLAKFARHLGFKVRSIDVARNIITSSQQYEGTKKYHNYLRESIIYLEKE